MEYISEYRDAIILGVLLLVAITAIIAIVRKPALVRDSELAETLSRSRAELEGKVQQLLETTNERDASRNSLSEERVICGRLETERDTARQHLAEQDARHVDALQRVEERYRESIHKTEERHGSELAKLEGSLREATGWVTERDEIIASLGGDKRGLEENLQAQREKHEALTNEIAAARVQLVDHFKAISSELLQNQGRETTAAQKNELEKLITPFRTELMGLRTNIKDMNEKAEKDRNDLGTQIRLMQAKAAELATEANSLAEALRGDRKRQGNWGEMILERILEAAGLLEGTHYTRQATTRDEEGKTFIPDVVVNLPGGRDVVIDSKVTLVAYQDMVQATDKASEEAALRRHVTAIRAHMNSLSKKSYDNLGYGSVDSVLMFLPVEGALSAALSCEPGIIIEAAEKRIHIMTPSTLMPTLKIVDHLWTIDARNKNVDDIVDRAGRLHDKFVLVVESLDEIGKHLRKATDCHGEAVKRMSAGPGNVIKQVDQLRLMGARNKKMMPGHILDGADDIWIEDASRKKVEALAVEASGTLASKI